MSNVKKTYFFAPTWDYPPETGPIQLGNIITSPSTPEQPLYKGASPSTNELIKSEKTVVEFSREKLRSGRFGLWTKFLSVIGIRVDAEVDCENR
jgi:hypothetical protein